MKAKSAIFASVILILSMFVLAACEPPKPVTGKYTELAKCVTSKGVILYGAFWCPHCLNQKKIFGDDIKYINYVECAEGGENAQPEVCTKAGVQRFPSWFFPGQGLVEGEQTPDEVAIKANCGEFASTQQTSETPPVQAPAAVSNEPAPPVPSTTPVPAPQPAL